MRGQRCTKSCCSPSVSQVGIPVQDKGQRWTRKKRRNNHYPCWSRETQILLSDVDSKINCNRKEKEVQAIAEVH